MNSQDVDFLLKVNFGLYRFATSIAIGRTELPSSSSGMYTLSVNITLMSGADVGDEPADESSTFLFVDIEDSSASLTQYLSEGSLLVGSRTDIIKGAGYHCTMFAAQPWGVWGCHCNEYEPFWCWIFID